MIISFFGSIRLRFWFWMEQQGKKDIEMNEWLHFVRREFLIKLNELILSKRYDWITISSIMLEMLFPIPNSRFSFFKIRFSFSFAHLHWSNNIDIPEFEDDSIHYPVLRRMRLLIRMKVRIRRLIWLSWWL